MGIAATRAKTRTGRAKAAPVEARSVGGESAEAILEGIFAGLPEALQRNGATPEVVRRNRRARAQRRLADALEARGPYPLTEALRVELKRTAEHWAQKDFADSFVEAEELELRCADERAVLDAAARGDEEGRFEAAEQIHRRQVEKRYGWIEIRGLQLSARVYQDLGEAYVPLQVEDPSEVPPLKKVTGKKNKNGASALDADMSEAVLRTMLAPRVPATSAMVKHPRLLLVGAPGSGKSTLVAYLATRAARGELGAEVGWEADPVPFVVPVRSLPAVEVTLETLASVAGVEFWFLEAALRRGRALLLVDGLDEARAEVAGTVLSALSAILDMYAGSRVLATTRPAGVPSDNGSIPAGFARVELTAMTRDEVGTFIDRWCLAAELSLGKTRVHAEAEAQAAAADLKERVRARRAIEKLAETPLLCSVICVVHRFLGQQIPQRRVVLYEAITNVLLYEWDRAKFPDPDGAAIGKLDAPAKRALLARLACSMHEAKVAELPEAEVVRRFMKHLPDLGRPAEESAAIVAEIRDRSGVLVERTPGSFAFSHLSFQEYLTALELVNAGKYEFLNAQYRDKWWHEVIVLAAGFPGADAAMIVRGLLDKDSQDVAQGTMLAAQCVDTAIDLPSNLREEIEARVTRLVPPRSLDDVDQLARLGDMVCPVLLREIDRASAESVLYSLLAFARMPHDSSLGAIVKLLSSSEYGKMEMLRPGGKISYYKSHVAMYAALVAIKMLGRSELVFPVVLRAMPNAHWTVEVMLRAQLQYEEYEEGVRSQIQALLRRYHETHPTLPPSPSRSPKRAVRSG